MSWSTGLTGSALNIASTDHNRLRVVAGPGTGKSFAIMRRVARLLEEGQDPRRILAVTFTRNAASSLVSDLNDIGVEGCEEGERQNSSFLLLFTPKPRGGFYFLGPCP